tara:strand:+ start:366 stop:1061 length:696 start_codon:yes stop_codon:yes gene_type:complete
MRIGILSNGPGLAEIVNTYGHSTQWIPNAINDSKIDYIIKKVYNNDELLLDDADAWIITGSKYSVYDNLEWIDSLLDFIIQLHVNNRYILGICFGHQVIAKALGGKVEKNVKGWELGSYPVSLTNAGKAHPLFEGFNNNDIVYESHQDTVISLPKDAIELAFTDKSNQSFCINDNIFGVQFHPEFSWNVTRKLMDLRISRGICVDNDVLDVSKNGSKILSNYINILNKGDY